MHRIVFISDYNLVVTGCGDKKARVYDAATGEIKVTYNQHEGSIRSLEALGKHLVASGDIHGSLKVWDVRNGRTVRCRDQRIKSLKNRGTIWTISSLAWPRFYVGTAADTLLTCDHGGGEELSAPDIWECSPSSGLKTGGILSIAVHENG